MLRALHTSAHSVLPAAGRGNARPRYRQGTGPRNHASAQALRGGGQSRAWGPAREPASDLADLVSARSSQGARSRGEYSFVIATTPKTARGHTHTVGLSSLPRGSPLNVPPGLRCTSLGGSGSLSALQSRWLLEASSSTGLAVGRRPCGWHAWASLSVALGLTAVRKPVPLARTLLEASAALHPTLPFGSEIRAAR